MNHLRRSQKAKASSRRLCFLHSRGYLSNRYFRPREGDWVDFDMLIYGQRLAGTCQLSGLLLDVDGGLDLIQAALLTGTAPGTDAVFWRPATTPHGSRQAD
ncbi:hypothetical protein GCM10027040_10840 [Halomonas shantousis]